MIYLIETGEEILFRARTYMEPEINTRFKKVNGWYIRLSIDGVLGNLIRFSTRLRKKELNVFCSDCDNLMKLPSQLWSNRPEDLYTDYYDIMEKVAGRTESRLVSVLEMRLKEFCDKYKFTIKMI